MAYLPIEHHGVIGDLHTAALVGLDGSIDWCCLPRFDSASVFGAILDDKIGGRFQITAEPAGQARQLYLPETNILLTRFMNSDGVAEITDFMPVRTTAGGLTRDHRQQIIRIAKAVRGTVRFRAWCSPGFNYARDAHDVVLMNGDRAALFVSANEELQLSSSVPFRQDGPAVLAEFTLNAGEHRAFRLIHHNPKAGIPFGDEPFDANELLTETTRFWRGWMRKSQYRGRWREAVHRSALALKLLTYHPTGAIVAAPTTSLPEEIGGVRNWDYRYAWVRDAAFTVYALMRLGFVEEAAAFASFIQQRAREPETNNGPLNVMYGIDGRHDLPEITLDHLDGYCGSRPVRIGNGAADHLQLDIYGELLDSVYLYDKYGTPTSYEMWTVMQRLIDWVAKNWDQPDQSIWEVRGGRREFTYSKLQCWVALDRGLRLASKRSLPAPDDFWRAERDRIYNAIMTKGWNEELRAFTQYFGSDALDAGALLMPLMLFISPTDPRMQTTLEAIRNNLVHDVLVRRYVPGKGARDGLPGGEGTFSVCSFWYAEALARSGAVEDGQTILDKMLTFANPLGLLSEEIGETGQALGNFPQALTHLGLISAAFNVDRALDTPERF